MTENVSGGLPEQGLRDDALVEAARKAVREMAYLYERHEGETDEELRRRGLTDALAWRHLRAAVARPRPALPLDLDALERAFIVYWKDFGTPRHNLTAAIREYLAALPAPEPRMGYVLAMAVLQSDAWASADDELRAAVEHFTTGAALPAEPPDTASPMIGSRRGRTDEAGSIPAEASGLPAPEPPEKIIHIDNEGVVRKSTVLLHPEREGPDLVATEFIYCAKCGKSCDPVNDSDMPVTLCTDCAGAALPAPKPPQHVTTLYQDSVDMSHDSRYETECPQHGWYFHEDGCAVAGCENAPRDG